MTVPASVKLNATVGVKEVPGDVVETLAEDMIGIVVSLLKLPMLVQAEAFDKLSTPFAKIVVRVFAVSDVVTIVFAPLVLAVASEIAVVHALLL